MISIPLIRVKGLGKQVFCSYYSKRFAAGGSNEVVGDLRNFA